METPQQHYVKLKNKDIGYLINQIKEQALQMDYHFKFDDEEFWQALEESIDLTEVIKSKSEFEKIEYYKTTKHLRDSVQEVELYEDIRELNAHLSYFRHCFLKGIPREKL